MDIVSTGVVVSPCVEVWQSGHRALEVVLLNTRNWPVATSDYHTVCHLYCTRPTVVMIKTNDLALTIMPLYLYLHSSILQIEGWRGAAAGVGQEFSVIQGAVTWSHQEEASRGEPAHMIPPLVHQLVTCGPARGSQGDAVDQGTSTIVSSTACHLPILGVAPPGGGERRHCAGEGNTWGGEHLHWGSSSSPSNKEHWK